jgi:uncharacterized sulfatase
LWLVGLAAGALAAVGAIGAWAAATEPARPHIVVFLTDDHGAADSPVYGAADIKTPNMQRLAAAGLVFDRAYVASPTCAPSRAALLTGLMPARNGAEPNHAKPRAEIRKLPAYLQELGYEVVAFGKVGHYQQTASYGFDHSAHSGFHEDVAIPNGIRWLRDRKPGKPLCIFFGTNWPHVPWPATCEGYEPDRVRIPPTHLDTPPTREGRARYCAAVTRMDAELGAVFDAARDVLGENVFFLTTSDNGAQWPFGKWNCYEAGVRTPMIAVWPGQIAPGTRSGAMVSWVDILPTLVELAGGAPPAEIDGRSFTAVLRGQRREHRDRIFTTHSGDGRNNIYPIRSVRTADWKYIRNLHPEFYYTTHIDFERRDNLRYFESWVEQAQADPAAAAVLRRYHERPAEELYDLRADPDERRNLAADPQHAQRRAGLRAELDAWMKSQGDQGKVFDRPRLLTDADRAQPPGALQRKESTP